MTSLSQEVIDTAKKEVNSGRSVKGTAEMLGVSTGTLYRHGVRAKKPSSKSTIDAVLVSSADFALVQPDTTPNLPPSNIKEESGKGLVSDIDVYDFWVRRSWDTDALDEALAYETTTITENTVLSNGEEPAGVSTVDAAYAAEILLDRIRERWAEMIYEEHPIRNNVTLENCWYEFGELVIKLLQIKASKEDNIPVERGVDWSAKHLYELVHDGDGDCLWQLDDPNKVTQASRPIKRPMPGFLPGGYTRRITNCRLQPGDEITSYEFLTTPNKHLAMIGSSVKVHGFDEYTGNVKDASFAVSIWDFGDIYKLADELDDIACHGMDTARKYGGIKHCDRVNYL